MLLRGGVSVVRPRLSSLCVFSRMSSSSSSSSSPWSVARALLEEEGRAEEAHGLLAEAVGAELGRARLGEGGRSWRLPLLVLELGKSLLKQNEPQDALTALEKAVELFQDNFAAGEEGEDPAVSHSRYVEALLHLAKLQFVSGQGHPDHLWKTAISHALKHEGRLSHHVLVASLGLAELHLERLQLAEADRAAAAAAELARELLLLQQSQNSGGQERRARERLVEAVAMQGLSLAQRQDVDGALRFYMQALKEVDEIEKIEGRLDTWTRSALHNLYRNIEHAYKGMDGGEDKAKEWKEKRDARLGRFEEVMLTEPSEEDKNKNIFT